jgi:hypothetical protein
MPLDFMKIPLFYTRTIPELLNYRQINNCGKNVFLNYIIHYITILHQTGNGFHQMSRDFRR